MIRWTLAAAAAAIVIIGVMPRMQQTREPRRGPVVTVVDTLSVTGDSATADSLPKHLPGKKIREPCREK